MFSLKGTVFSGGPVLGRGLSDWDWTDPSTWGGGSDSGSTVVAAKSGGCPAGQIEFGSPSQCGSQADYDAYVKAQVAKAYGGDQEKATTYLQTTQYGQGINLGCSFPNQLVTGPGGATECLSPARYNDRVIAGGGGKNGLVAIKDEKGKFHCFDNQGVEKPCPSGYVGANTGGGSVAPKVTPGPMPVPVEAGTDWLPLAAVGLLVAAGGYLVWKKKHKMASNWHEEY